VTKIHKRASLSEEALGLKLEGKKGIASELDYLKLIV
jgi:hypothetical protein